MKQRGRTGWRRWLVRGAVCVGLGVVTTVGVAWGLALFIERQSGTLFYGEVSNSEFGRWHATYWSSVGSVWRAARFEPPDHIVFGSPPLARRWASSTRELPHARESWGTLDFAFATTPNSFSTVGPEQACGWPRLALYWRTAETQTGTSSMIGGLMVDSSATSASRRVLPLLPIWSGLAFNILCFAAAWSCVVIVPIWYRQSSRYRRGHCPACGYDLVRKFDAGCSECGWNRA